MIWPLFLLSAGLALGMLNNELGNLGGDNAGYILLAKSLASGQGYRSLWEPMSPLHTVCPIGLPLLLSPIVSVWGTHAFLPMHLLVMGWALLCLLLWWRWVREETTPGRMLAASVLLVTSPLWVWGYGQILSEFPYLALSLWALMAARQWRKTAGWRLGAALAAPCLFRAMGVALIGAVLSWLAWQAWSRPKDPKEQGRGGRVIATAAWATLPLAAWALWNAWATGGALPPYARLFLWADPSQPDAGNLGLSTLLSRAADNVLFYLRLLGEVLFWPAHQSFPARWASGMGAAFAALITLGFLRRFKVRSPSPAEGYVALYASVLLLWPFHEERFLLPVLPWLWFYLLEGLRWCSRKVLIGWATANLAGCLWFVALNLANIHYPPISYGFLKAHEWLRANGSPEQVVMTRKPALTALLSGCRTVPIPFSSDPRRLPQTLREFRVTYVLDDGLFRETQRYLQPAVLAHLDLFEPEILRFGPSALLKVRDDGTGVSRNGASPGAS